MELMFSLPSEAWGMKYTPVTLTRPITTKPTRFLRRFPVVAPRGADEDV